MSPSQRNPELLTLQKVINRLQKASIPYMLTGSMAMNFYGHPRATNDFDLVIEIHHDKVKPFLKLFEDDFYVSREAVEQAVSSQKIFNAIDNETVFKIDFIVRKNDPLSLEQFKRRKIKEIEGLKAYVISPEDLILAKLNWAKESLSEIQKQDVKNLLDVLEKELDYGYLEKQSTSLGLLKQLRELYAKT